MAQRNGQSGQDSSDRSDYESVDDTQHESYERRGWRSGSDYYGNSAQAYGERPYGQLRNRRRDDHGYSSRRYDRDFSNTDRDPDRDESRGYGNSRTPGERGRFFNDRWENSYGARHEEAGSGRPLQFERGQIEQDQFEQGQFEQDMGSFRGRGPKGYRRSDERIREDVCERLTEDHGIDATSIEVAVRESEVTLLGSVSSRETKRRAEIVAEEISGVKDVHNMLRIESAVRGFESGSQSQSDHSRH